MGRSPEVTEAQLIERTRMAEIETDAEVIAATIRYEHWIKLQRLNHNDGVSQMLVFLRETLQSGVPLTAALRQRSEPQLDAMVVAADKVDNRLSYAVRAVIAAFRADPNSISYDPRLLYFGTVIRMAPLLFPETNERSKVEAINNTTFERAIFSKTYYALILGSPELKPSDTNVQDGLEHFETAVLKSYFNISYHCNNISGRNVWQEGEEIALGIYAFIQSQKSRGQLCSLLPSDGPETVDWRRNDWVHLPVHKAWLNYQDEKDLMRHYDTIAAMP